MLGETGWTGPVQTLPKDEGQYWLRRQISSCFRQVEWMLWDFGSEVGAAAAVDNHLFGFYSRLCNIQNCNE